MAEDSMNDVQMFCYRLRQLRKRLNLTIEELALRTNLKFAQIRRTEVSITKTKNEVHYKGADGKLSTLVTLLMFYSQYVSLDLLANFKVPVNEIPFNKGLEKELTKEKILALIEQMTEITKYLD